MMADGTDSMKYTEISSNRILIEITFNNKNIKIYFVGMDYMV